MLCPVVGKRRTCVDLTVFVIIVHRLLASGSFPCAFTRVCLSVHCWRSQVSTLVFWRITDPCLTYHLSPNNWRVLTHAHYVCFRPFVTAMTCCDWEQPLQSAYRQFHSTESAVLKVYNDLLLAADHGQVLARLFVCFDLTAAFNTIDHDFLVLHLECQFGLRIVVL